MTGRYMVAREKPCGECGRVIRVPAGWFADFAAYTDHINTSVGNHALEFVMDHPSLVAMLDQADAAARDSSPPSSPSPGGTTP